MNINRKAGTRNSWQEMDIESRAAVYMAERLVEGRRGVEIGNERVYGCTLEIRYGHNIVATLIEIVDSDGFRVAFFSDGYFYDNITKLRVELI